MLFYRLPEIIRTPLTTSLEKMNIFRLVVMAVIAMPALATYLTATIRAKQFRQQREFLIGDVVLSIKEREVDMRSYIENIFRTFDSLTFVCDHRRVIKLDETFDSVQLAQNKRHTYCTSIFLTSGYYPDTGHNTLTIQIIKGFKIHLNFLKFHFEWKSLTYNGVSISEDRVDSGRKTTYFTGIRRPWTMIVDGNTAEITITKFQYSLIDLDLFYSACKWNWFSEIQYMYSSIVQHFENLDLLSPLKTSQKYNMAFSYQYIQIDYRQISFSIGSIAESNAHVFIYDGPGRLSRRLLEIKYHDSYTSKRIVTTTFFASVLISILSVDAVQPLLVSFRSNHGYEYRACRMQGQNLWGGSNPRYNTICILSLEPPPGYRHTVLYIDENKFRGSRIITTGYQVTNCQYGGLYTFPNRNQHMCRDFLKFELLYNRSIDYLLIAWLKGYSWGSIKARLTYDEHCTVHHVYSHASDYNQTTLIDDIEYCKIYICPPPLSLEHKTCNLIFKMPERPVGTFHTKLKFTDTTEQCIYTSGSKSIKTKFHNIIFLYYTHLQLGYTKRQKFILPYTKEFTFFYEYLVSAEISLPLVCVHKLPFKRASLMVMIATCSLIHAAKYVEHRNLFPIGHVVVMAKACEIRELQPAKSSDIVIYHEYYHKNYTGHQVYTRYTTNCPMVCKKYTYTLKVYHKFKESVYDYSANVGDYVFTGMNHQGLWLKINGPSRPCHRQVCRVLLNVREVETVKGLSYTHHSTEYKFYTIRSVYKAILHIPSHTYTHSPRLG